MVLIFSPWRVTVDNNQEISEGIREKKESITNLWLHCTFSQSFPGFISHRFRFKAESTIWKLSFASTVRPIVHTNPSRKLNFWKTLFKLEGLYNGSFFFRADKKHFENRCVFKRWHHDYHVISPMKLFFETQIKHVRGVVWTESIWCVFKVKLLMSNFSTVVWWP